MQHLAWSATFASLPACSVIPVANPPEGCACGPSPLQVLISDICSRLDVDGLRGDIVINRAAKALVAYEGRSEVTLKDVERIIPSCLNHRWAQQGGGVQGGAVRLCIGTAMPRTAEDEVLATPVAGSTTHGPHHVLR